jgi:hypothetical protein
MLLLMNSCVASLAVCAVIKGLSARLVFGACETGSFARSVQGRIHRGPKTASHSDPNSSIPIHRQRP